MVGKYQKGKLNQMAMSIIDRERVLHLFNIDMESGKFFWKNPSWRCPHLAGSEAGHLGRTNGKPYWIIKIDDKAFKRGRLMFLAVNGFLPNPCVDHRDGNSLNDRPDNLRQATITENAWNHKFRARKQNDLPMGVRRMEGRFQARIGVNKKLLYLGVFDTPEEAHAVYLVARKEHLGEFA
jgi:hypothetical protein